MDSFSFPIFDNITLTLSKKTLDIVCAERKKSIINNIEKYTDTHELIYAIIRLYQIKNSSNVYNTPYNCKYLKTKKGYKFDLELLPNKLLHMIIEFYNLHINSLSK